MLGPMNDLVVGRALCAIRIRKRRRQEDVAAAAGTSRWTVARVERGRIDELSVAVLRRIVEALDARLDLVLRWQGAELDRLVNARHAALHGAVLGVFADLDGWSLTPEVSFSIYGERGIIDILAWHAPSRTLLVIELKTEIVDVNDLMGTMDRRRRLAPKIAAERGLDPARVGVWVVVEDLPSNHRRLAAHEAVLRAAFPSDGRTMRRWLHAPTGPVAALSFLSIEQGAHLKASSAGFQRVRRRPGVPTGARRARA
jgi:transcriptional regulator with XRE-family HTH domain